MSFNGDEARAFFAPLRGKAATFLIEDRMANLCLARTVIGLLSRASGAAEIFDLDAFYSSNADRIFASLGSTSEAAIRVPAPGARIDGEFARLFEGDQDLVIVDSLNSLYHLISQEDGSSRGRRFNFAVASLSYLAKTSGKSAILSMYRREGLDRWGTGRSISSLSDITASVDATGPEIVIRAERGPGWDGGAFSTRIPSE